jgi:hypothetical protein
MAGHWPGYLVFAFARSGSTPGAACLLAWNSSETLGDFFDALRFTYLLQWQPSFAEILDCLF